MRTTQEGGAAMTEADEWQRWTDVNLRRGVDPGVLRRELEGRGFDAGLVETLMGPAYTGRTLARVADHAALAAARITETADDHPDIRRVATSKAQVFTWANFLPEADCAALAQLIEAELRASVTVDPLADAGVRTSKTSDIGGLDRPIVRDLEDRISEAVGIHWSYSEVTQGQRYMPGEEYKAHFDYFTPGTPEYRVHTSEMGQRTWTVMVYLNAVEDGGATRFRKLDRLFRPETGTAVIWNNLNADGTVNPATLHHGMRVRSGRKYVVTKWFRERGYGDMLL